MSVPPVYEDLGKNCRDFFGKGFPLENVKVSGKYCDVNTTVTHKIEDNTSACEFESKFEVPPWGIHGSTKIDTTNVLGFKIDNTDKITPGLKVGVDTSFNLESQARTGKLFGSYKIDHGAFDLGVEAGDETDLLLGASAVGTYQGLLGGYQLQYDNTDGTLKKNNIAVGYCGKSVKFHGNMDNAETITGILHTTPLSDLEVGLSGTYTSGDDTKTRYGLGVKYIATPCTSFKAKIDNTRTITVACEMKATTAATLTLCAQCDGANAGKLGASVEFVKDG